MKEKLSFAIENVELMEEANNDHFATLKIDAFASGENRHSLYVSEDTLKKTAKTILQKPIVWAYNRLNDDASSHDSTEIICGFIPHDTPIEFRKLDDGRTMMSVVGKLWTRYSGKLMDIFRRDKNKGVSVEMEVFEEDEDSIHGMPEILNYCFMGITVLGNLVKPAIPLANAELLSFAEKEREEYQKVLAEFSNKYANVDMTIPKEIKSNAKKALDLYRQKGLGGSSVSLAIARHLVNNEAVSIDKVKAIHKYLNSHKNIPKNKDNPNAEYISWMLHGGSSAFEWSKNVVNAITEIDEKQLSYFGDGEVLTFPYEKISDANPAIKGIEPPVTVGQANQIARVAESIGVSEEKNGWAISISNFKKSHHVEDGHWVKNKTEKEELSVEDNKDLEKKEETMSEEKLPESEKQPETEEMAENKDEEKEESEEKEEEKEEPKEDEKEEKDEPKEEKMSLDLNLDMAAYLGFLEQSTEANEEIVAKYKTGNADELDHMKIHNAAYAMMCKMAEDLKKAQEDKDAFMAEFDALKKFKEDTESRQFAMEVENTLIDVAKDMPKEEIDKARERSKEFSIESIDAWKNEIKATAYSFSKGKKEESDGTIHYATSWVNQKKPDLTKGWTK